MDRELFGRVNGARRGNAFAAVMPEALAAPDDCGGLLALPFMDDEPGLGVSRGGTACVIGLNDSNATPGNVAKAMLLATIFNLKIGSDDIDSQGFSRTEIVLSGGVTKTSGVGQIRADAFNRPVSILDGAAEGTALGGGALGEVSRSLDRWPGPGVGGISRRSCQRHTDPVHAAACGDGTLPRHGKTLPPTGRVARPTRSRGRVTPP